MKALLLFALAVFAFTVNAQTLSDSTTLADTNVYRLVTTDGGELIGQILSQNEREIYFKTSDGRRIYIPQYTIKSIEVIDQKKFNNKGEFIGEDRFSTRYFLTTNGLPIQKGEHYIQWNLFGPDLQFGIGENLGVGVMTSWIGLPVVATVKKSWIIGDNSQFALGALAGTGSWALPEWGGLLPFATLSLGDRTRNIAFSGGYGAILNDGELEGRVVASVGGMIKISTKLSLVFDSFFLMPGETETRTETYYNQVYNPNTMQYETQLITNSYEVQKRGFAVLVPGVRWHQSEGKAFQFGFSGIIYDGEVLSVPIPMVQWYRSL
ncbi:hypothetical protein SAMN05216474_0747 [Lishizhenia tianjinensis]|uniref:Uncharacterized protein n=1 Tax=Lishizhenia tianjinensis TaxID=477690 RepID=A0A1I6Y9N8_9FLAO|nr:hypothetical protein [Lishizhenia tianjinensis]SFT47198.1 hypothetical protein SAMN05216474_0747 [Lishizhenia tianjinensis]